jgi:hypothetical protein
MIVLRMNMTALSILSLTDGSIFDYAVINRVSDRALRSAKAQ